MQYKMKANVHKSNVIVVAIGDDFWLVDVMWCFVAYKSIPNFWRVMWDGMLMKLKRYELERYFKMPWKSSVFIEFRLDEILKFKLFAWIWVSNRLVIVLSLKIMTWRYIVSFFLNRLRNVEQGEAVFDNHQMIMDYINARPSYNANVRWGTLSDYFELSQKKLNPSEISTLRWKEFHLTF